MLFGEKIRTLPILDEKTYVNRKGAKNCGSVAVEKPVESVENSMLSTKFTPETAGFPQGVNPTFFAKKAKDN